MASIVESKGGYTGKGTTVSVTLSSSPTSGNMLVAMVSEASTSLLTSLAAGAGKNFSSVATPSNTGIQLYALYRLADGTESSTITATFSSNISAHLWVAEFSGADVYQSSATNTGSGAVITCGTDGDSSTVLDVAVVGDSDASAAFSGATPMGYTLDNQGTGSPSYVALYRLDGLASSNPGTTGIGNANWAAAHMTFELASTGQEILALRQMGY